MGTRIYTPEQQLHYNDRKEKERQLSLRRVNDKRFTLIQSTHHYSDIKPESLGRLVYLSTFLSYESDVVKTQHKDGITKKELTDILKLPRTTLDRFLYDVDGKYIFTDKNGFIHISKEFFIKGTLPKSGKGREWQKVYIDALRELYLLLPPTDHRYLGYIFQMLQLMNIEYNILCHNPYETDLEKVTPISLDEFCAMLGYSRSQRMRLVKIYSKITFVVSGNKERFCSFVTDMVNDNKARIYVNPDVIYKGSKWDEVKILGKFCNM